MRTLQPFTPSVADAPAWQLAQLIRQKQLSPVEVMDAHLQRIGECNPLVNAFACIDAENARAQAKRAEAILMAGETEKPLLGLPLSIKSSIDVEGFKCESGSLLRAGTVAAHDAPVVARLKQAGAILIGNTNTPELLIAYHTENLLLGRTNNPWDLMRTVGGSSGGEAAAISCGMSAGGFGSDGGGSIRVPAHFCGICGLKPTPGIIPAVGHYPPCAGPFSLLGVIGPMARTVEDLRLLMEAARGYNKGDPVSIPVAPLTAYNSLPEKMRIGFYEDDEFNNPTPETRAAVRTAAKSLEQRGFAVEPFRPEGLDRARQLWFTLFVEAIAMVLKSAVAGREREVTDNTKEFLELAAAQPPLTGERLLNTLIERDTLRAGLLAEMEHVPILIAPVCSIPAFPHEDAGWGLKHAADYVQTMSYCQHYSLLGNPAAVVPIAQSPEGMPIGVQVVGRPFREDEVLSVAGMLDEKFGWKQPPLI